MGTSEHTQASSEQSEPKRRSPAEAFDDLKASVNRSEAAISDLWDFAQKVKDKLFKAAELHRLDGMLPVLDSMLQLHQILFLRVKTLPPDVVEAAKKAKKDKKDKKDKTKDKKDKNAEGNGEKAATESSFTVSLLETLEEELTRHGIQIVKPEPGAAFDLTLMDCTRAVEKNSRKDKPNTVAAVNRCGFLYQLPSEKVPRIVAKAQVDVFAK